MSNQEQQDGRRAVIALTTVVAISGILISLFVLRKWSASGGITLFSYAAATLMYVLFPSVATYRYLDKQIKNG